MVISRTQILFYSAAALLAAKPVLWLLESWLNPIYGQQGLAAAILVAGLFVWSVSSSKLTHYQPYRLALVLLICTALVRLVSQVLAINVLGALTLVIDVYAIGLLTGIAQRKRALSPIWLAILFAFALPLERIIQRSVGFVLQQLSADGACAVLSLGFADIDCQGVRILLAGRDVLVDLPCSGARSLLLLLMLFTLLATLMRPSVTRALAGLVITLSMAFLGNVLRIILLALGIAFPDLSPVPVMASPWHDLIGLVTLTLAAIPVLYWAGQVPVPCLPATVSRPVTRRQAQSSLPAVLFIVVAVVIISLPARPVDVAKRSNTPELPLSLAGIAAQPDTLSQQEQVYFTRYGGGAARSWYGSFGLLLVSTSAPLRHLHAPDECLTGLGHDVDYIGVDHQTLNTAIYRSTDPDGNVWRIAVTYVNSTGQQASSVSEVVWHWLRKPGQTWTLVQRITPWQTPPDQQTVWDQAVAQALDLSSTTGV